MQNGWARHRAAATDCDRRQPRVTILLRCWQCLPSSRRHKRGRGKKNPGHRSRKKERKKDGGGRSECSDAGVCTVCLRIAAEKILFFCQWDVPEGDSEDYSLLTPGNTLHAEALQPRQPDRTAGKMSWVRHLRGGTVVSRFLNMKLYI